MNYWKYAFEGHAQNHEILVALLSDWPFDTFEEAGDVLHAYLPEKQVEAVDAQALQVLLEKFGYTLEKTFIEYQNWNAAWESNFQPIRIGNYCYIRADFHAPATAVQWDLVINPKMAFGTGHHETTRLMIRLMQSLDFKNKKVLDFGCGTGILAILAAKEGATIVAGVDIETAAYENSIENAAVNRVDFIDFFKGGLDVVPPASYDVILANINRNVILESLPALRSLIKKNGILIISGFLKKDEKRVRTAAVSHNFKITELLRDNQWIALKLELD